MKRLARWAWVAVVLAALPARAATFQFVDAKLQLEAPDGWKTAIDHEHHVLHMTQPDQHVAICAYSVEAADLKAAVDSLATELAAVVKDGTVVGEIKYPEIHGMRCAEVHGKGRVDDKDVEWFVCLVGAEHPVLFVGFGIPDAFDAREDEIEHIFDTIEPLK